MFSVMQQEKTNLRDGRGASVYRRVYICDTDGDIAELPTGDAPGSVAVVAMGGGCYLLDHGGRWQSANTPWVALTVETAGKGGGVWRS